MDVFPLPLLVLLYEKFSLFSSKFKTIRSLEKGVGLKQLTFLSPCFFTGNILSILYPPIYHLWHRFFIVPAFTTVFSIHYFLTKVVPV